MAAGLVVITAAALVVLTALVVGSYYEAGGDGLAEEIEPDAYTCNLIEEEILSRVDELERNGNIMDVSGLYHALDIVRDIRENA